MHQDPLAQQINSHGRISLVSETEQIGMPEERFGVKGSFPLVGC
jgi:hypothetical protein